MENRNIDTNMFLNFIKKKKLKNLKIIGTTEQAYTTLDIPSPELEIRGIVTEYDRHKKSINSILYISKGELDLLHKAMKVLNFREDYLANGYSSDVNESIDVLIKFVNKVINNH